MPVKTSEITDDGNQRIVWTTKAFNERLAREKSLRGAQLKGLEEVQVEEIELKRENPLPNRNRYNVTLIAAR